MANHQELVKEITQELYKDENVLALILYGSVSRHEEQNNSDIDFISITTEMHFQVRQEVRHGIAVEFHDMHMDFLKAFIEKKEISISSAVAEGIVLFNKTKEIELLIANAKKIHENTLNVNTQWEDEKYKLRKRFELTDIYKDLLDIDDEVSFNYVVALLITSTIPMLNEIYNLRKQSKKKTIPYLKSNCYDGYVFIEILLSTACSIPEKREAAKRLIDFVLKAHGGILEGNFTLFSLNSVSDL